MYGKIQETNEWILKEHFKIIINGFEKIRIKVLHKTLKTLDEYGNVKSRSKLRLLIITIHSLMYFCTRTNKEHAINSFTMQRK